MLFFLYNFIFVPILNIAVFFVSFFNEKIYYIRANKKNVHKRISKKYLEVKSQINNKKHKCIWIHVASVGEFLQIDPIIKNLKKNNSDIIILLTFTSLSGIKWIKNYKEAHIVDIYPLEDKKQIQNICNLLQPKLLLLIKYDLWPCLISVFNKKKIPIILCSFIFREKFYNKNFIIKFIWLKLLSKVNIICTVDVIDKTNLQKEFSKKKIFVLGDMKYDYVFFRKQNFYFTLNKSFLDLKYKRKNIIVAGSIWPDDEKIILPTIPLQKNNKLTNLIDLVWILVPHEVNNITINKIENYLLKNNLKYQIYDQFINKPHFDNDAIIINKVGILFELYNICNLAYVGSGKGGVHNVLEPFVWGTPIFFRDHYFNSIEACELVNQKYAFIANNSHELSSLIDKFTTNNCHKNKYKYKKEDYNKYILKKIGATEKYVKLICQFIK